MTGREGQMGRYLGALAAFLVLLAACSDQESPTPVPASPTPLATATPAPPTATPTPTATPRPTPSPEPTATPTPSQTPTPQPTFSPGAVILPTVGVPVGTPTPLSGDPLLKTLDSIDLLVNVARGLSSNAPVDRFFISREEISEKLLGFFEEDRDEIFEDQRLYAVLGILERDVVLYDLLLTLYSEGVLGCYDTEEQKLFVVQETDEIDPSQERTYVHEIVHHLQQQNFDTYATRQTLKDNRDAARAFRAIVEGDARLAELVYVLQHMSEEEREASQGDVSDALVDAFFSVPRVVQRAYGFPYQEGAQFALSLYREGGWNAINLALEEIPQSTEQILHPERYAAGDQPQTVELPDLVEVLGEGWSVLTENTLGELFFQAYLEGGLSTEAAAVAAEGWGGDRFVLLDGPGDEDLFASLLVWDTEEDAQEFFDTFMEFTVTRTGAQWETAGEEATNGLMMLPEQSIFIGLDAMDMVLVFAPDVTTLETARGALQQSSAAGVEGG